MIPESSSFNYGEYVKIFRCIMYNKCGSGNTVKEENSAVNAGTAKTKIHYALLYTGFQVMCNVFFPNPGSTHQNIKLLNGKKPALRRK